METTTDTVIRGGQFIVKTPTPSSIFTIEDLTEEQRMMRESTKEFAERELWANWERFEKKDYEFTKVCMQKAGELGLLSIAVPESYGGMGMGFVSTMLVCDYISGVSGSFSTAFGAHTGIGTMPITLYGNEEQKQKYVPKLASGEWFGAYCLTEPGAGSDANSGKTKAVLADDGSHYLITGQKMWISNAGFANLFIVFARIEDDKNITGFIVENDPSNGISYGEEEHKLGIHSSSTRQVFFNETKVPVENMLSERGNGFKIAMNALNVGRIKLAAACIDGERRVIREAVKYAKERVQFGTPIADFGAIKEKLAVMATNCYADESATYRAAKDIENSIANRLTKGSSHQEAELKGVEEFAIECSILKVIVSEHMQSCSDEGIQIFGGMGFSADAPMESAWRDARISRIYEGTNEINRMLIVGTLLKRSMKKEINLLEKAMVVINSNKFESVSYDENNHFASAYNLIANLKNCLLYILGKSAMHFGNNIKTEQEVMMNIADMIISVYVMESTLKRCEKVYKNSNNKVLLDISKSSIYYNLLSFKNSSIESIISFMDDNECKKVEKLIETCTNFKHFNIKNINRRIADYFIEKKSYNIFNNF